MSNKWQQLASKRWNICEVKRHREVEEGIRLVEAYVPKRIKGVQSVGLNPIARIAHNILFHFLFSSMGHSCVKTLHKKSYIN